MRYNFTSTGEALELTERQKHVCLMMAQGLENKEIAYILHVTEHTVKTHVQDIMDRLCALNRAHCVALAAKRKLINLREVEEGKDAIAPRPVPPPTHASNVLSLSSLQPAGIVARGISRVL